MVKSSRLPIILKSINRLLQPHSYMKKILYILIITAFTFAACTKTEETLLPITESKIIVFDYSKIDAISQSGATISSRLVSLNQENVQEYGVLISRFGSGKYGKEEQITLGKGIKIGPLSYSFAPKGGLKSSDRYTIGFYIQTDKGFYRSASVLIRWNNISVEPADMKAVRTGDKITINGNFDGVDESYLIRNSNYQSIIPYEISSDKKKLTYEVPKTNLPHGSTLEFYLQNISSNGPNNGFPDYESYALPRVKIAATIDPIILNNIYFITPIILTGQNLPDRYQEATDLFLIVNGIKVKYQNPLNLNEIAGLKGNTFKIGYHNGINEVIFPNAVQLILPNGADMIFNKSVVHPKTSLQVSGMRFNQLFYNSPFTVQFGEQAASQGQLNYDESILVQVPDVNNGSYAVSINSPYYDKIISKNKIEVRKLILNQIETKTAYVGDQIKINGTFLDGIEYGLSLNDIDLYDKKVNNGTMSFKIPDQKEGKANIKIYYYGTHEQVYGEGNLSFTIEKSMISSVSPLQAYPGDLITVKGKGLKHAEQVFLGGHYVQIVNRTDESFQFLAPSNFMQAKGRVTININEGVIQSDDYIEIR